MKTPWNSDRSAANGRSVAENFAEWFGQSKVVDAQGQPLMLFHGTFSDFDAFRPSESDFGIHFGTVNQANSKDFVGRRRPDGRILPVYLAIENPLRVRDVFRPGGAGAIGMSEELFRLNVIDEQTHARHRDLIYTSPHVITPSRKRVRQVYDEVESAIRDAGFDGLVYENLHEFVRLKNVNDDHWSAWALEKLQVIENPLFGKGSGSKWVTQRKEDGWHISGGESPEKALQAARAVIMKQGGIPVHEDSWMVLDAHQVKSAIGNSGLFLKGSPSITDGEATRKLLEAQAAKIWVSKATRVDCAPVLP